LLRNFSQEKRDRQNEKRRLKNKTYKTRIKNLAKKVETAISEKNKDEAVKQFKLFAKAVDKICRKGIIHNNNADRKKSRMNLKINAI